MHAGVLGPRPRNAKTAILEELKKYIGTVDEDRVKFLVAQEVEDEIEASLACIRQLCDYASTFQREKNFLQKSLSSE